MWSAAEGEPIIQNPLAQAVFVVLGVAFAVGWILRRHFARIRKNLSLMAILVPIETERAFQNQLTAILRPAGFHPSELGSHPMLFEPNAFRRFAGGKAISVDLSSQGTAQIVGPTIIVRALKFQFPGAEEKAYPSEPPRILLPFLKVLAVFLAIAGVIGGAIFAIISSSFIQPH